MEASDAENGTSDENSSPNQNDAQTHNHADMDEESEAADSLSEGGDSDEELEVDSDSGEESDGSEEEDGENGLQEGSSNEESGNEESSGSSDDEEETPNFSSDGREISAYEQLRLDRIRRNKEKLAQLGLQGQEGSGVLGKKRTKKRPRKKKEEIKMRSSLSRHTKQKPMNYAEPSNSVSALLRKQSAVRKKSSSSSRKSKGISERMDKFIHLEFKRMQGHKTTVVKRTNRFVKHATRELAYWSKRKTGKVVNLSENRLATKLRHEEERQHLGSTAKEFLQQIDARMPELLDAAAKYDSKYEAAEKRYEREARRLEEEHRMALIDSLERFPKAMKEATSLLNATLLERTPKDAPAPRRSRRSIDEEEGDSSPKRKQEAAKSKAEPTQVKRKRQAKNVGGWISPDFAVEVDRSWLNRDATEVEFDIHSYAPQTGDVVLYYPNAHRKFLREFPDFLGRKAKAVSRLPLWERAAMEGEKEERMKGTRKRKSSNMWYTEEWLEGIDGELGRYPILCKVHSTTCEFPSDYFTKIVKDGVVSWKAPKESSRKPRDESAGRLRMSIVLRPLTPVVPPAWESTREPDERDSRFKDDQPLSPAPLFTVVTFPCKMPPFLVPFAWAYTKTHLLSKGLKVTSYARAKCKIEGFNGLSETSFRLEDKGNAVQYVLDNFTKKLDDKLVLMERKTNITKSIPLPEVRAVLDVFHLNDNLRELSTASDPVDFLWLVRSTLPLWGGVVLAGEDAPVNPWELTLSNAYSSRKTYTPQELAVSYGLDEPLRARIAAVFDKIMKENPQAVTFQKIITDEEAASYSCAVPVPMSFEKIQQRLQPNPDLQHVCYYSTVESVLADVSAILDNCLLYNSPDSPVVEVAADVVARIKEEIVGKSRDHIKEMDTAKKASEDRKLRMMQILDGDASNDEILKDLLVMHSLRLPRKTTCETDWLESVAAQYGCTGQELWVPQAGDKILYSPKLHSAFVEYHERSLEPFHCSIHNFSDPEAPEENPSRVVEWKTGRVVWTRSSFPARKKSTFSTPSTLLVLGIKFDEDQAELAKLRVICWRPNFLAHDEVTQGDAPASFLKSYQGSGGSAQDEESLSFEEATLIVSVLSLLKKRCLKGTPIDYVDHQLTKQSLKAGYLPLLEQITEKNAPLFPKTYGVPEQSLGPAHEAGSSPRPGTRGVKVSVKPKTPQTVVTKLLRIGFLAPFASARNGEKDEGLLQRHATYSPWPKMSLELILLRLSKNFYRSRSAVENDIIEAYASVASLALAESVSRKREPASMKKICKALASEKGRNDTNDKPPPSEVTSKAKALSDEETKLVSQLRGIRELYATALVAAAETKQICGLFGLSRPAEPELSFAEGHVEATETESQASARQRLQALLEAVGRDSLENTFAEEPSTSNVPARFLKVTCGGKEVNRKIKIVADESTVAEIDDKELKVRILCDNKIVTHEREKLLSFDIPADLEGSEIRLKVVCDDDTLEPEEAIPMRRSKGKAKRTTFTIKNRFPFGPDDYERNDAIVPILFGRNNRRKACARCNAYRRSMLTCRVRRGHSNPDFDWIETFKGVGGLDNLLKMMAGEEIFLAAHLPPVQETQEEDEEKKEDRQDEEVTKTNPGCMVSKAETALALATSAQQRGAKYASAPLRLSKDFVTHTFPIDPSDGHCVYCIICGMSGDLLCCDGCSNVVHGKCVGVDELPEGDWFCEECQMKSQKFPPDAGNDDPPQQPFGRFEYDSEADARLVELLDELRSARPDTAKRKHKEPKKKSPTKPMRSQTAMSSSHQTGNFPFLARMAQDFLADTGIADPDDLLNQRTIDVAKQFAKWRRKVGMPKLNGGGESAYVGSWKGTCRKQKEGDEKKSIVYLSDDLEDEGEEVVDSDDNDFGERSFRRKKRKRKTGARRSKRRKVDPSEMTDPIEGLSDMNRQFLQSLGITTASEFLSTRTSELGVDLIKWRKREGLPPLKGTGDIATISAAKTLCRNYANEMGLSDVAGLEPPEEGGAGGGLSPGRGGLSPGRSRKAKNNKPKSSKMADPIEGLSDMNRRFLQSLGITTASDFLSTRTSELGVDLIKWRKREGLPPLKGTGDIATISAAKSLCRNCANKMGLTDVAGLEPPEEGSARGGPPPRRSRKASNNDKPKPAGGVYGTRRRKETTNSKPQRGRKTRERSNVTRSNAPVKESSSRLSPRRAGKRVSRSPDRFGSGPQTGPQQEEAAAFSAISKVNELLEEPQPRRKKRRSRR